jgi:4-alpha-glucanotransferase
MQELIKSKKRAGVSFPLVSLLNENSYGCGDIYSLHSVLSWAKKSGLSLIQILPLNDLGWGRSPYSSISAFAIDPIYISLHLLGISKVKNDFDKKNLDHKSIKKEKIEFLREHFLKSKDSKLEKSLKKFLEEQKWLEIYLPFVILYTQNDGKHWNLWKETFSQDLILDYKKEFSLDYQFYLYLQYIAFQQLKDVQKKLESSSIYIKGDMPILTSDNSADVWGRRNLFNRELTSGAPPDYFNKDGQNWGFPVINWEEMKKESYSWWKERLDFLQNLYHLYRIDHVLGMYRIWAVPKSKTKASEGYFHPQIGTSRKEFNQVRLFPEDFEKLNLIYEFKPDHYIFYWDFFKIHGYQSLSEETKSHFFPLSEKHLKEDELIWKNSGEEVLKFLFQNSKMYPCAEDLGAVPSFVRDSIIELKLLGLDIIRWTRSFEDGSYIPVDKYRSNAVSSLSVHDTSTALGWWKECTEEDKYSFMKICKFDFVLNNKKTSENPEKSKDLELKNFTEKDISKILLKTALNASSLFSIHMLQDYIFTGKLTESRNGFRGILSNPEDHRINIPGTSEEENWGYIFPFYAEELVKEKTLIQEIHNLVKESGRE